MLNGLGAIQLFLLGIHHALQLSKSPRHIHGPLILNQGKDHHGPAYIKGLGPELVGKPLCMSRLLRTTLDGIENCWTTAQSSGSGSQA